MPDKVKLIALDIDGTIMNSNFRISDRVKDTILMAINSGIYVVLVTGRMYSATVPIANSLGIKTPLITYQGSLIKEFYISEDTLLHHTILPDLAKTVVKELKKFAIQTNVYLNDEMYVEHEKDILKEYAAKRNIVYQTVDSFDKVPKFKPTKILAMDENPDRVSAIKNYLKEKFSEELYITKSTLNYCEIVNNKASKAKALLFLADRWGIKQSEIMAIGDQDNDKDMLEIAGVSVAMGNSDASLKQIAKYTTTSVDEDGAAIAIEKLALELSDESAL